MKRLLALIMLLASSLPYPTQACSYYPYGEDIRFSLFDRTAFGYNDFAPFMYSASWFCSCEKKQAIGEVQELMRPNIDWWQQRCKLVPSEHDTYEAIYGADEAIKDPNSANTFVKYLYEKKDKEAIAYLTFAQAVSVLNSHDTGDPWERNQDAAIGKRKEAIELAKSKASTVNDKDLSRRYAFLAIRLAYYNKDNESIKRLYAAHFQNAATDLVSYWALSFFLQTENYGPKRNFFASQVFANAPDKRVVMLQYYDRKVNVQQTLAAAKTGEDKSAVWLMEGIRKPGRAIESLRQVYKSDPTSRGLSVLLLREINKLEDWIFTPHYTLFNPSISETSMGDEEVPDLEASYALMHRRMASDRLYAQEMLNFANTVKPSVTENPALWHTAIAYLHYMCEKPNEALAALQKAKSEASSAKKFQQQWDIIEALCLTAKQPKGNAQLPDAAKQVIFQTKNPKLILAFARELEYKGNTTQGALLLSKVNEYFEAHGWWDGGNTNVPAFWKAKTLKSPQYNDFYDDYFFYMDGAYTPAQVAALIDDVKKANPSDAFGKWLYGVAKKDVSRLYDLLGTKYVRKNDWKSALAAFEQVNDTLWTSSAHPYKTYLNANPFYTNLYNEHTPTEADTVVFNKESLTRQLIEYLGKAENVKEADRDRYYFLVANCYLNMTTHGNSWMMRRYYWSNSVSESGLEDDEDYLDADMAKMYYLKAKEHSKTPKFAALCLRMAGRCEKYELLHKAKENYDIDWDELFRANTTYRQLHEEYPESYEDLISNCSIFGEYFEARR